MHRVLRSAEKFVALCWKNSSAGFDQKKWLAKVAQLQATWGPLCCTLYNFVTWKYYKLIINYTLCILNWGPLDCAIHNCPNVCQLFLLLHKCAHSLIPHSKHSTQPDMHSHLWKLSFVHYILYTLFTSIFSRWYLGMIRYRSPLNANYLFLVCFVIEKVEISFCILCLSVPYSSWHGP